MPNLISQPTMMLRWIETEQNTDTPTATTITWNDKNHYKLQQYCKLSDGTGQWRDVSIEYRPHQKGDDTV